MKEKEAVMKKNFLSVIVPCFNEEEGIEFTIDTLVKTLGEIDIIYELIVIDDGSSDNTFDIVKKIVDKNPEKIKCISFGRNFGKEAAIFAGMEKSKGDCIVVIDSDLQHPPKCIKDMYELWLDGYDIIEGIKKTRQKENVIYKILACLFYYMFNKSIGMDIGNASDFKLLDRKVVNSLLSLSERTTFFRGLTFWTGYKRTTLEYEVNPRRLGKTKWNFTKLVKYAINNIICFSAIPLRIITILSISMMILSIFIAVRALRLYFTNQAAGGITTVVFLILFVGGLILLSLSILGKYIANIHEEIKARPRYIITREVGENLENTYFDSNNRR